MGFSQDEGYVPSTIEEIMDALMEGVNTQFGTTYTTESFVGTNFYKYFYTIAQRMQQNEVKTSEIFAKLQQYLAITNEAINRPVATNPGLLERLEDAGYIASIKAPIEAEAGELFVCVDIDEEGEDYAAEKLEICTIIKDSSAAGVVSQGTEEEAIVLTNGQSFDFKYNLPDRITALLRLTITLSTNNQVVVLSPDEVKQILIDNIEARYRLGKNFEPQRYFGLVDAPWASDVLLEWSDDDGENWSGDVYEAEYDELFEISLENISVVEE